MKKYILSLLFCLAGLCAMGQSTWFDNLSEASITGYYYYNYYNNTIFPDSSVKVLYSNGAGGTSLYYVSTHGVGEVFDPKSIMYNNPISPKNPYKVDSVGLYYFYNYVPETGAAPDTLIFQFYTGAGIIGSSAAIDTGYFSNSDPYAIVKYDYTKNLGVNPVGQVKYILKPNDTASVARLIKIATNGTNGISVKANDLFAYTVSYRQGFKYKTGDTIDEKMLPKPAHLHSHFRIIVGDDMSKNTPSDYEESATLIKSVRYNADPNWDGYYIPGTAWNAYNQVLWSAFYIEIQKPVNLGLLNDAGIYTIANPASDICAGQQPVKVVLENFGRRALTSARINWAVNGTLQTPYYWSGFLNPGSSAIITISNSHNFTAGSTNVTAFTSQPNGVKDSLSSNDSSQINFTVNALPVVNAGSASSICNGKSITIGSSPVSGYSYNWTSIPFGFSSATANPTVSPNVTTTYFLNETDNNGCSANGSVAITVNPTPDADWTVVNLSKFYIFKMKDSSNAPSALWDFGDGSSATLGYHQTHVFPNNTSYTVKLTVVNNATCTAEKDSSLAVTVSQSGIWMGNQTESPALSIYPNPATNLLNLEFTSPLNSPATITITDQLGRIVGSRQIDGKSNAYSQDISGLAKGIYILNVQMQDKQKEKYLFIKD